jgi:hypothetical protein
MSHINLDTHGHDIVVDEVLEQAKKDAARRSSLAASSVPDTKVTAATTTSGEPLTSFSTPPTPKGRPKEVTQAEFESQLAAKLQTVAVANDGSPEQQDDDEFHDCDDEFFDAD